MINLSLFEVEPTPPASEELMENIDQTFKQQPVSLKLPIPQITERIIIEKHDNTPLMLGVCLFAFLGFLAFLAFMRKR